MENRHQQPPSGTTTGTRPKDASSASSPTNETTQGTPSTTPSLSALASGVQPRQRGKLSGLATSGGGIGGASPGGLGGSSTTGGEREGLHGLVKRTPGSLSSLGGASPSLSSLTGTSLSSSAASPSISSLSSGPRRNGLGSSTSSSGGLGGLGIGGLSRLGVAGAGGLGATGMTNNSGNSLTNGSRPAGFSASEARPVSSTVTAPSTLSTGGGGGGGGGGLSSLASATTAPPRRSLVGLAKTATTTPAGSAATVPEKATTPLSSSTGSKLGRLGGGGARLGGLGSSGSGGGGLSGIGLQRRSESGGLGASSTLSSLSSGSAAAAAASTSALPGNTSLAELSKRTVGLDLSSTTPSLLSASPSTTFHNTQAPSSTSRTSTQTIIDDATAVIPTEDQHDLSVDFHLDVDQDSDDTPLIFLKAPPSQFAHWIFEKLDSVPRTSPSALVAAEILKSTTVEDLVPSSSEDGVVPFRFDQPSPDDVVFKAQGQRPK